VASGISARVASNQMHQALALRYRLPGIAKLMAEGTLSARLAHTITWRTQTGRRSGRAGPGGR